MAKFTFLNMPTWGHVNPTLAIVQELIRRGEEVDYYLTEEFRKTIEATGATFHPYVSKMQDPEVNGFNNGGGRSPLQFLFEDKEFVPLQIMEQIRAEQPDVVVYDFMCFWAKDIVDALAIPAIAVRATYASNEHFSLFNSRNTKMAPMPESMRKMGPPQTEATASQFKTIFRLFSVVEQLNIIFMPKAFQPMAETFDERFLFIGSSILPRHQIHTFPFELLDSQQPLLYISMGSIATNQPEFYKQCFEAFGDQPWQVVLSVGKQVDVNQLRPVPANFVLSPYVPQLEILSRASIFVTHAGTNSIMESLSSGVPMVLIPQQPEQFMHAQRAVELGLGVQLDKDTLTASSLLEAVEKVAHSEEYHKHAQAMKQTMLDAGGYQRAVDAIIQFAEEKK